MTTTAAQLRPDEMAVLRAIDALSSERRTTNNSQIASAADVSRTFVRDATVTLRSRKLIVNVSKGAAYHWRLTPEGQQLLATGSTAGTVDATLTRMPTKVAAYFERKRVSGERRQTPQITQIYCGVKWEDIEPVPATFGMIRLLADMGAQMLGITGYGSVPADFTVHELLAEADKPLLGGALVGSRTWNAR